MTPKTIKKLRLVYAISVSAMLAVAGICLIIACLGIYFSGHKPYSPEAVAAAFSPIAIPVYLCLALVLLGFVLELILPREEKRRTVEKQRKLILSRLYNTADMAQCDTAMRGQIQKQQNIRRTNFSLTVALLCMGSLVFFAYIFSGDRFPLADINGSVIRCTLTLLLCMTLPLGYAIVSAYWSLRSMDAEIQLLKQLPKRASGKLESPKKELPVLIPRVIFLSVGLILLIYGFLTGGTADVLVKAINICTECVGLG